MRTGIITAIVVILAGTGWLLNTLGYMPRNVDWIWVGLLGMAGALSLVRGLDRVSVITGPFLLLSCGLSILRQTGNLKLDVELPILVIAGGVLLLLACALPLKSPSWWQPVR